MTDEKKRPCGPSDPRMSRRGWMTAIGAAAALGVLTKASFARAAGRTTRMVLFFTPHGAPAELFWPKSATDLSSSGPVSILAPLQKHAAKLNVVKGIDYVGSDNHPAIHDVFTNKTGTSIDTAVAKKIGVKPLRLGVIPGYAQSFTVDGQLAYDGGTPLPHGADPVAAFDALVSGIPTGGAPAGPSPADFRRLAAGVTAAELDALKQRLGASTKIDKHVAAMRAATGAKPTISCSQRPSLPSVEKLRGKNVWAAESFPDVLAAQLDNATLALRCGITRVVSIQCGYVNNQIPFSWIGIGDGHHNLSHNSQGAPGRLLHAKCQEWFAGQLAKFLDSLEIPDPDDPGRTLLDNTIVVWATEIADGQGHGCQTVPWVLAGGGGGYFKTGQYVQLPSGRSHASLLLALAESMGATGVDVGAGGAARALREVKA